MNKPRYKGDNEVWVGETFPDEYSVWIHGIPGVKGGTPYIGGEKAIRLGKKMVAAGRVVLRHEQKNKKAN